MVEWYVSNVSIFFDCSMLLYYLFWMFMGFIMHFYIIFGTNLLTEGPVPLSVFLVSQKSNIKRSPNGMKPLGAIFLEQTQSRRLGVDVKKQTRRPRGRRTRPRGVGAPPSWAPHRSPDRPPSPIYTSIHWKHLGAPWNLFPPPQPSVPVRSHLGAFSGILPEGDSITEGIYINSIALPMKHE